MLINILGRFKDGKIHFELPACNFDLRFNFNVSLRYLHFKSRAPISNQTLLCLTTNIIDCSASNPLQALYCFKSAGSSPTQDFRPIVLDNYPLQTFDLLNSDFQIRDYLEDRSIDLEYIFLLLEISRLDSYGRI